MSDLAPVESVLPHRPPFLFVDRIVEMTATRIVGVRTFRADEQFFKGHFPDCPIVPGVLLVEGLAQTMAYYALTQKKATRVFLVGIDHARFRGMCEPGTEVTYEITIGDERFGTLTGKGRAHANGRRLADADVRGYAGDAGGLLGVSREPIRPAVGLPEGHFDVLIVGSGMGGLSSALLLAREGFKVCVVEQHYRPGGCLHRFFRKRIPFDTGMHYLGGIDEGGTLNQYLKFMGVRDRLSFHHLDPDGFDILRFPGYEFRVPAGWPALTKRLMDEFPNERDAIRKFSDTCQEICHSSFAYSFQRPPETGGEFVTVTLSAFLKSIGVSDRLRAVLAAQGFLYGVPPDETPLELHAHVLDSMLQGPAGIDGGGEALAQTMVKAIREAGGVVRTRTKVLSLDVKDLKIERATLEKGDPIFARTFISNTHPHTMLNLVTPGSLRPAYTTRVREMKNGIAAIAGYFLSSADTAPRRNHNIYVNPNWNIDQAYLENQFGAGHSPNKALFITFPSDREREWPFPRMVLTLGMCPWAEVAQYAQSKTGKRDPGYYELKNRWTHEMQRAVEEALPDHAGKLTMAEVSTPLTNRDYTGAEEGAIYGLRHGMDCWGKYALHSKTKIDNLLLTGHSVLMPGIVGVTIGAFVTCSYLLGFEQLFDRVAKA